MLASYAERLKGKTDEELWEASVLAWSSYLGAYAKTRAERWIFICACEDEWRSRRPNKYAGLLIAMHIEGESIHKNGGAIRPLVEVEG